MLKVYLIIGLIIFSNTNVSAATNDVPDQYYLTFSEANPKLVKVTASLTIKDKKLEMASWGHALQLEDSWAHFINDLKVTSEDGTPIAIEKLKGPEWKIDVPNDTLVNLHYEVNLTHSDYDWTSGGGDDARPEWTGKNHFLISKALFIISYKEQTKSNVSFNIPAKWSVSSAWKELGENRYQANDVWSLINNALVVGLHQSKLINIEGMNVRVVTDKKFEPKISYLTDTLRKQLVSYKKIFNEIPPINYLIAVRKNKVTDGEAFNNSFNLMIKETELKQHTIIWSGTLAHEMFHYWTTPLTGKEPGSMEWFREGFTDYYSSITLARTGIISEELWHKKLEKFLSRYYITRYRLGTKPSLVEAGKDKIANWFLIYGGGASIALILDIEIRDLTGNKKSLDDVMTIMYRDYYQKPFTIEELEQVVSTVSGKDMRVFFEQYILGDKEMPNIEYYLNKIGLNVSNFVDEYYIERLSNATNRQRKLYKNLLHKK